MKLGLIGCGKMGAALLNGILKADPTISATIYNRTEAKATALASSLENASVAPDLATVVKESEVIIVSVKPYDLGAALSSELDWSGKLLISVAAGVTSESLLQMTQARVLRVMPNTPSLIGQGASAYCLGALATEEDAVMAERLLQSVGQVVRVEEKLMDAVTGVSGSGPAYVYTMIEAMSDAGVKMGLPRTVALQLATQTLKGAAMMVEESGLHPGELKDQVTSPGGTTIAGIAALEEHGVRNALIKAVEAATIRSAELG